MGIESWVQTSFLQNNLARPSISSINSKPMLVFSSTPELSFSLFAKQIFDRICAFIALIFAAIPIAIAAILSGVFQTG